jgi:hypothetical protein
MRWTARRSGWLVAGVAVLLGAAAVSRATIPAADGTIAACYHKRSGKVRLVDGTPCKRTEAALSWSQAGPPGETGATGAPASSIFAFVQVWQCCGMSGSLLDPPLIRHGSGITAVVREGPGQYVVTVSRDVTSCLAVASLGSDDAATPVNGTIAVNRPNGLPADQFKVFTRNSAGAVVDLGNTGGTYGFSIAVFCPPDAAP